MSSKGGVNRYAFSEFFRVKQGQTIFISNLIFANSPPRKPQSLQLTAPLSTLNGIGQTVQMQATDAYTDGTSEDVSPASRWTTYRISSPAVATVSGDGLVTARGNGAVFVTAVNEGTTAVARILVSLGDRLTSIEGFTRRADGTSVVGTSISLLGLPNTGVSGSDGHFAIAMVATLPGNIIASASATSGGAILASTSQSVPPVSAGITDVGTITVVPQNLGVIFASDPNGNRLLTINPATGQGTVIGSFTGAVGKVTCPIQSARSVALAMSSRSRIYWPMEPWSW